MVKIDIGYFMKNLQTKFQSYLFLGTSTRVRQETENLAKLLGINFNTASFDISVISPIKVHISITQIRQLKKTIYQKPFSLAYKIIVIEEAEKLTIEAQNALLKILEEPPLHAVIVLEAKDKSSFLPTVRSRVVTKQLMLEKDDRGINSSLCEEKSVEASLGEITNIDNSSVWLDKEIRILHGIMISKIKGQAHPASFEHLRSLIEKCIYTKKLIAANVNSKFALANLIFSLRF